MVETAAFVPQPIDRAVHALLAVVAQDRPDRHVLLVRATDGGRAAIEDACPPAGFAGDGLAMPAGLLGPALVVLPTATLRLSLAWTQALGCRPRLLAACPVPDHPLWLVVADGEDRAPDQAALHAAADALGPLLDGGRSTRREQGAAHRLGALIDALPAPLVFVDARRLQVYLNDGARTLLDLQTGDLQETSVAAALARLVGGSDAGAAKPQLAMEPTAHMAFDIRHDERRFAVETLWVDQAGLTGRIWQFRDVTLERTYQAQLADLAALLELTVENVREGVALVDEHLRIILSNADFPRLLGYADHKVAQGSDFMSLMRVSVERGELGHGETDMLLAMVADSIRSVPERRLEMRREDGRILDLWRKSLDGGRFILVVRDVTEERQIARLKDDLVSTASHELRTPLTGVLGSLKLVMTGMAGTLPETARALLDIAQRNADRLDRLINDLLDLDKLQLGRMELRCETVDLAALLADAAEQNALFVDRYGVSIRVEIEARALVHADPFRLMQVLTNLLSNAAKFSPAGSMIRLVLGTRDGWARISVIDQGRGISPAFRKRLFTRFAQEQGHTPDRPPGSGLGLAISKGIVDEHGGTIETDDDVAVGATFHIGLPLAGPGEPDEARA